MINVCLYVLHMIMYLVKVEINLLYLNGVMYAGLRGSYILLCIPTTEYKRLTCRLYRHKYTDLQMKYA